MMLLRWIAALFLVSGMLLPTQEPVVRPRHNAVVVIASGKVKRPEQDDYG